MCPTDLLSRILRPTACACLVLGLAASARAAAADDVQKMLLSGDYTGAIRSAESAMASAPNDDDVTVLYIRALLTVGRYEDADLAAAKAVAARGSSIRIR